MPTRVRGGWRIAFQNPMLQVAFVVGNVQFHQAMRIGKDPRRSRSLYGGGFFIIVSRISVVGRQRKRNNRETKDQHKNSRRPVSHRIPPNSEGLYASYLAVRRIEGVVIWRQPCLLASR